MVKTEGRNLHSFDCNNNYTIRIPPPCDQWITNLYHKMRKKERKGGKKKDLASLLFGSIEYRNLKLPVPRISEFSHAYKFMWALIKCLSCIYFEISLKCHLIRDCLTVRMMVFKTCDFTPFILCMMVSTSSTVEKFND